VRAAFPTAVVLRPSIVFGPEDDFFNRFAAMAQYAPALPMFGGGTNRFQPVYVGDVADAIMAALTDPATDAKTYELGGPRAYTFEELMTILLAEIRRERALAPFTFAFGMMLATVLELLPVPPLTRDQIRMLRRDNVVGPDAPGLRDLGIAPTALEPILPTYLDRFRPGGRFAPAPRLR
jgi:NADH dehydrogenase